MFGIGDALSIGGALVSGLGGGKKTQTASAPVAGFDLLPQAVKDAYLNTYLPDVLKQYQTPREPIPMVRADAPQSVFDPIELSRLQQFSDAVGGYFSPKDQPLQQVYNPQPAAPAADPAATARQGNIDLARQFASMLTPRGKTIDQSGVDQARLRLAGMNDDDLALIGQLIAQNGGLGKAVNAPLAINDLYSAQRGQSFV